MSLVQHRGIEGIAWCPTRNVLLYWCLHPQVKMWNTRLRLMQLVESARDLAQYGPAKPPAEHGLDEVSQPSLFFSFALLIPFY